MSEPASQPDALLAASPEIDSLDSLDAPSRTTTSEAPASLSLLDKVLSLSAAPSDAADSGSGSGQAGSGPPRKMVGLLERFAATSSVGETLDAWLGDGWLERLPASDRSKALARRLNADVGRIDRVVERQVNAILHHPKFQRLESSWRGVEHLARCAAEDGSGAVRVRVLSVSWREVVRDQEPAIDFDTSDLFRKIYSEEFDTPGGTPFGMLVGDYEIHPRPNADHPYDDIETLRKLSGIAAAAFCPLITAASPAMFGLSSYSKMERVRNLSRGFQLKEFIKWRALREAGDSRFLGLALPRVLMRKPHQRLKGGDEQSFAFEEDASAPDGSGYLWGNAAYAFAEVAIRAFGTSGWLADIRGVSRDTAGGGLVTRLVSDDFSTDRAGVAVRPSTDATIAENEESELASLGFLPLCHCAGTPFSAFYNNASVNKPATYDRPDATQSARLSSMLQYTLCVSRFAHALKSLARQKIGSGVTADECQSELRDWLMKYVSPDDNAKPDTRARRPLRQAEVNIEPDPAKPGAFQCVMRLAPHYQLDELSAELEFTTAVGSGAGSST